MPKWILYILFMLLSANLLLSYPAQAQKSKNKQDKALSDERKAVQAFKAEEAFTEGMKQDILENHQKALEQFEKSSWLDPENPVIFYKMADVKSKMGRFAEAEVDARKALQLDKNNSYYYYLLWGLLEKQNKFAEAVKVVESYIKKFPATAQPYFQLAALQIALKDYKKAYQTYEKIEQRFGTNNELFAQKQQLLLNSNQFSKALKEARKYVQKFPQEPAFHINLAQLLMSNNMVNEAGKELKLLYAKVPNNPLVNLMLADFYSMKSEPAEAEKHLEIAFHSPDLNIDQKIIILSKYLKNDISPVERDFALKFSNIMVKTHPNDAKAYSLLGDFNNLYGDKAEARHNYIKAAAIDPSRIQLWEQIVLIDANFNDIDSLAKHSGTAAELFPNREVFWYYNGLSNLIKKKYTLAIESLEQALRLSKGNKAMQADIHSQLGDAYHAIKKYDESDRHYEDALLLNPENTHVLNNYSYYLSLRKEHLDKANNMTKKLLQISPDEPTYIDTRAWVLYMQGKYQEAYDLLKVAADKSNSGTIIEHFGDACFKLGLADEALKQWQRAKEKGGELSEFIDKKIADRKLYE
jgi:tetratricopeptide (TPR) repeat protein